MMWRGLVDMVLGNGRGKRRLVEAEPHVCRAWTGFNPACPSPQDSVEAEAVRALERGELVRAVGLRRNLKKIGI